MSLVRPDGRAFGRLHATVCPRAVRLFEEWNCVLIELVVSYARVGLSLYDGRCHCPKELCSSVPIQSRTPARLNGSTHPQLRQEVRYGGSMSRSGW